MSCWRGDSQRRVYRISSVETREFHGQSESLRYATKAVEDGQEVPRRGLSELNLTIQRADLVSRPSSGLSLLTTIIPPSIPSRLK